MPDGFELSPIEAAEFLGVHVETLKRWVRKGKVPAFRTPGGWWKFRRSDLEAFVADSRPDPEAVAG